MAICNTPLELRTMIRFTTGVAANFQTNLIKFYRNQRWQLISIDYL